MAMKHSTHLSKLIFATDNIIIEFDLASLVIDGIHNRSSIVYSKKLIGI